MPLRTFRLVAVSLSLICPWLSPSLAQPAAPAARDCPPMSRAVTPNPDQIRDRAARIKELRALTESPDQNLRMAAFDEMIRSCDLVMQELAFEGAFNSSEISMRALALRMRLVRLPSLTIEVNHGTPARDGESRPPPMNGRLTLPLILRDEGAGVAVISASVNGQADPKDIKDALATVKAQGLELIIDAARVGAYFGHCHGRMRLGNAGNLAGTMSCYLLPNLAITARML